MPIFDIILLIILVLCVAWGLSLGFVGALGYVVGLIVGIISAGQFYPIVTTYISPYIPIVSENIINILSFFVVLSVISKLVSFIIDRIFGLISIIPFVKTFNRLLGALLGLIGGVIVTGALIYMMSRFPIATFFEEMITNSKLAPTLLMLFKPITILFPEILKEIKSLI